MSAPSQSPRKPRPWLAALLSLIVPPAGFVYVGSNRSALIAAGTVIALYIATVALMTTTAGGLFTFLLAVLLFTVIVIGVPVIAFRKARRAEPTQRSRLLMAARLLVVVTGWFLVTEAGSAVARTQVEAFRTPSVSMAPSILPGDFYLVRKGAATPLTHGQVVAFYRAGSPYVFRIAGLPGDTLSMSDGVLQRNGTPVDEPYLAAPLEAGSSNPAARAAATWGPTPVPRDHIFVLGDNRESSLDSRYWGFLPADSVFGVPARIYFSRDPLTGIIRWNRIGRPVPNRFF
jgi:signal peptidase I